MKPAFKHSEYAATSACSEYWKCCWTCVSLWVLCAFEGRVMWNSVRLVYNRCACEERALGDVKRSDAETWCVLLWNTEAVQSAGWWCSQERVRELWLFWWHLKNKEVALKLKQRQDEDVRKSSPDQGTVAIQWCGNRDTHIFIHLDHQHIQEGDRVFSNQPDKPSTLSLVLCGAHGKCAMYSLNPLHQNYIQTQYKLKTWTSGWSCKVLGDFNKVINISVL